MVVHTRVIAVASCMGPDAAPPCVRPAAASRCPWRRSTGVWLLALMLLCAGCTGPMLQVAAIRARANSAPQLLHVQAQSLHLHSVMASPQGMTAADGDPDLHQSTEHLALVQFYFDRAMTQHTLPADLTNQPMQERIIERVTCGGADAQMQGWTLPSGALQWNVSAAATDPDARILALVSPVESWMEHFNAEQSLDDDEEEGSEGSDNLFLPSGALSSTAPFASNEFAMLIRLRGPRDSAAILDGGQLRTCSLRLRLNKLLPVSDKTAGASEQLLEVSLAPRKAPASPQRSRRSRQGQPNQFGVSWPAPIRSQRWIMPSHLPGSAAEANSTADATVDSAVPKLPKTCASLREEQRLVFLEDGVSSVGAMLGPIVSTMMAPVTEQFEQLSTIQVAQQLSKNYVSSLTGSIPPEVSKAVSAGLEKSATDMAVDLLTTSLTASCSSDIANTLGAYLTRSVSGVVGDSVHDHLLAALTTIIPPDLSTRLAISVTKSLPERIIKDVSMSLTHTLVGSLTRGLSGFNHMQKLCRSCKLYGTRCSDCRYVHEVAKSTSSYSAQYSHYYGEYYSAYYAPIAAQMGAQITEMAKPYTPPKADDEEEFGKGGPKFPGGGEEEEGGEGGEEGGGEEGAAAGGEGGAAAEGSGGEDGAAAADGAGGEDGAAAEGRR